MKLGNAFEHLKVLFSGKVTLSETDVLRASR